MLEASAYVLNRHNYYLILRTGPVAQRLEQRTHNPLVPGSNPGGPTNIISILPKGFTLSPVSANACTERPTAEKKRWDRSPASAISCTRMPRVFRLCLCPCRCDVWTQPSVVVGAHGLLTSLAKRNESSFDSSFKPCVPHARILKELGSFQPESQARGLKRARRIT
jgi:hypothetical protein